MTGTVLILGASGRFGKNAAEAFWNAGWRVRLFDRTQDDLLHAADGVDVIVNGWNPPYHRWAAELPGLTQQVIEAARASKATVLVPGNVYVYGADAPDAFSPGLEHRAANPLGKLRIEMEQAYRQSGVQTILLRAGDFLDTEASGNWFDEIIVKNLAKGKISYPGAADRPHAWAYLPDLARAATQLCAKRQDLPQYAEFAFEGYTLTGSQLADAIADATGTTVRFQRMAWWPLQLVRPFWPLARGLVEMRYLWDKPHHLVGNKLREALPEFHDTPLDEALRRAVAHTSPTPKPARAVPAAA